MSEPFLGQIITTGFNFAPRGYANCDGQMLPIAQNSALFALLGTQFGGNGTTNFRLPDLRGRVPIHQGQGQGLSSRVMGESAGEEAHTLTTNEMPMHSHAINASSSVGDHASPAGNVLAQSSTRGTNNYATTANATLAPSAVVTSGGGQAHNNMQPYLVVNYAIALTGIFPSRD